MLHDASGTEENAKPVRQAVRVLLVDQYDRVLLVRFRDGNRAWWCTPVAV